MLNHHKDFLSRLCLQNITIMFSYKSLDTSGWIIFFFFLHLLWSYDHSARSSSSYTGLRHPDVCRVFNDLCIIIINICFINIYQKNTNTNPLKHKTNNYKQTNTPKQVMYKQKARHTEKNLQQWKAVTQCPQRIAKFRPNVSKHREDRCFDIQKHVKNSE